MKRWRVGAKVKLNVYDRDRPVCQCHNERDASRIAAALNHFDECCAQPSGNTGEPKCKTCGDTERVCRRSGLRWDDCKCGWCEHRSLRGSKPCPDCTPVVPVQDTPAREWRARNVDFNKTATVTLGSNVNRRHFAQMNPDFVVQFSDDNGKTWVDAPEDKETK